GHLDADGARGALPVLPLHVDAALRIALEDLRAVERMHGDAAPARDETRDPFAGKRTAALPEAHQHVLHSGHLHAARRLPADQAEEALQSALGLLPPALELLGGQELREHLLG